MEINFYKKKNPSADWIYFSVGYKKIYQIFYIEMKIFGRLYGIQIQK